MVKNMRLLLILAFVTLSVVPQAIAQSCAAEHLGLQGPLPTHPSPLGSYRIKFTRATIGSELPIGYLPLGDTGALYMTLPQLRSKLSLTGYGLSAGAAPLGPGRNLPAFNWWCFVQCLRMGGNFDDCSILCSGKPVQQ